MIYRRQQAFTITTGSKKIMIAIFKKNENAKTQSLLKYSKKRQRFQREHPYFKLKNNKDYLIRYHLFKFSVKLLTTLG